MGDWKIDVVRKETTTSKLTIAHDGRIELKLKPGVDAAGEEWLRRFCDLVINDARKNLPTDRTLRGRFRRRGDGYAITFELEAGEGGQRKTLKYYHHEDMGLPTPPETV